MTQYTRADVDMADRHIAEGEVHIGRQKALITRLQSQSLPVEEAEHLLTLFRSTMDEHRAHRAAIVEALVAFGQ